MKKIVVFVALVIAFVLIVKLNTYTIDYKDESTNMLNRQAFLDKLTEYGYSYKEIEEEDVSNFLSVKRRGIFVGDEIISIYEYSTNKAMESDSKNINKDGFGFTGKNRAVKVDWVSEPHFFKKDLIIINYVGTNKEILDTLNKILGAEFAGISYIENN